ncbi:hypothetical protein [Streptomyces sp. N35]|uniref:hypothetical protein n=1 Tax=Streptomyces sp. N35 TaxID=2795730 RepID=UPI0018F4CE8B|nr:hypothetical protein [Streptomyces sp. N35]
MGKKQRGRRHRSPQKRPARQHSVPAQRNPSRHEGALPLKGNLAMQATLLEQAPPEQPSSC